MGQEGGQPPVLKSSKDVGMSQMLVGHLRVRKSEFRSVADVEQLARTMG